MKNFLIFCAVTVVLMSTADAFAGGAAAGAQQKKQMQQQMMQQEILKQQMMMEQQQMLEEESTEEAVEEVDISELWKTFKTSSEAWTLIIDRKAKVYTVAQYIENYRKQGIHIRKSPLEYAQIIDSMANESPNLLQQPFDRVLMIVSVIEYDFDNGQDKDKMAMQILGQEGYASNKQRLGIK